MEPYQLQIIQTLAVIISLVAIKFLLRGIINKFMNKLHFALERKRIISKIINFFILIVAVVLITAIWGVKSQEVTIFISSILTILGVAFFAQWSILSNISSSLILFFNHPVRIGSQIKILDKEYPIEGVVVNISLFFMYIKTTEGQLVSIPNTIVLQKTISLDSENMDEI
ncbi:MAG: mechanosensitive ion channel family protein [Bacteroidetes bacterium]|jgi:small-conductance mechanosensitive channel|nr:mechanosensitive ion channel family protein [Bacteroidota bacterium]